MVRFANPEFFNLFWLIPAVVVFLLWAYRRRRQLLDRLGDQELVERLLASISQIRRRWKAVLVLLTLSLMALAMVDPQVGTRLEEVKREGIDIFIALDVSKSMLAEDIAPNRIERAKNEISRFISGLNGDRIGLIAFAGLAFVQCPLTLDYSAARLFLDQMDVGLVPQPGTSLAEAIRTANTSFVKKELKHKVLILITDGEDHEGEALEVAKEASQQGMVIYTIGIGSPQGAPIPELDRNGNKIGYKKDRNGQVVTTRLDIESLEKIAFETGGKFYISSSGNTELSRIFEEISGMEKKELASREFTQYENRFQNILWFVLAFLGIESLLGERRRRRRRQ